MGKIKVLGVCAGNGINLHPFLFGKKFQLLGNIEPRPGYYSPGKKQWRDNFGEIPMIKDYHDGFEKLKPDVIIGNPKCGASSIMRYSRSKELGDAKSEPTLNLFIEVVTKIKPKVFMMENLPKLKDFIDVKEVFSDYEIIAHEESVSKWGNSQFSRKRLVIIGVKKSFSRFKIEQFAHIFPFGKLKTSRDLLTNLRIEAKGYMDEELCHIRENLDHKVSMYDYRNKEKGNLTLREIKELWTNDFKDEYKWPINSGKMKTLPGIYRNRPNAYPMTVRKESRQFRWDGHAHTPRELAVFQGIPLNFKLHYESDQKNYWLNKARFTIAQSPPYEIGLWFKNCLA